MFVTVLLLATQVDPSGYLPLHRDADRALVAGRAAEARATFEKCLELAPQNSTAAYGLACAHARAGETDAALRALAQAVEWGYAEAEIAVWDEDLANLREDAAFGIAIDAMRHRDRATVEFPRVQIVDGRWRNEPLELALDADSSRVVLGHPGGEVRLLDARSGVELPPHHDFRSAVWDLDVSPDRKSIAILTLDGRLHFWKPESAEGPKSVVALRPRGRNDRWPACDMVAFDPTGERVLAAGEDRGAILCSGTGRLIRTLEGEFDDACNPRLAWSPDGSSFVGWNASTVTFHDGQTGLATGEVLRASRITGFAFGPDGLTAATGHDGGTVLLWRATPDGANPFEISSRLEAPDVLHFTPFEARELAFSPDGRQLAVTFGTSAHVSIFDVEHPRLAWTSAFQGGLWEHLFVSWSAGGRRLWWAWDTGALNLCHVDLDSDHAVTVLGDGRPPVIRADLAVFTNGLAITALDATSGGFRWARVTLGRPGVMFFTPSGYFDCDFDDLSELFLDRHRTENHSTPGVRTQLAELATKLFDPKRVRAAKAGVALAPITW